MKLAFIGLGKMGTGMARNLLRAGHQLTVYNRTREKAEALTAEGAHLAATPEEACRGCDAVVTMLSDDHAVEEFAPAIGSAVHAGCSTISTALARRLAADNPNYLSSPVFGRPEAAEAKRLLVVPAGPTALVEKCRPVFDAIGRQAFLAGEEPWQANAVKLCGNFMIASMLESFSEAFATLRKAEVDPHLFLDVMNALFGSAVYANYGRAIADEQFEPAGFALKLGLKDVRLALETAHECASPMPFASILKDQFLAAFAAGQGEMDWASVAKIAARNAGLGSTRVTPIP
jgi:3-hydroxyisobutyrate dehydrogenase-like beta-hydroxyacid dehydrogenase